MSYNDLIMALAHKFRIKPTELLASKKNQHRHALNVVYKGEKLISNIEMLYGCADFKGKRVLDVGCGYGGVLFEFAKRGAVCTGIDLSDQNLTIAKEYFKNENSVEFYNIRADTRKVLDLLPVSDFDIIIATSVMEHIYDIQDFVINVRELLKDDGIFYYTIPNHNSFRAVEKEPHAAAALLSIIPPDKWCKYNFGGAGVYHRPIGVYESVFLNNGFAVHRAVRDESQSEVAGKIRNLRGQFTDKFLPHNLDSDQMACVEVFLQNLEYDLVNMSDNQLYYKYIQYDHSGIFIKNVDYGENVQIECMDFDDLVEKYPSASVIWSRCRELFDKGLVKEARKAERLNLILHSSVIPSEADLVGVEFGYGGIGVVINKNCKVGSGTRVGSNVTLGGGSFNVNREDGRNIYAPVIGRNVYIATGAKVLGGCVIGDNCVIGANAVVNSDFESGSVVAGVPARKINSINRENYNNSSFGVQKQQKL